MKFSAAIVAAIAAAASVTDVSAFGVHSNLAIRRSTVAAAQSSSSLHMSLDDLQSKLLTDKPAPVAAAKKSRGRKSKQPEPAPAPTPEPEPVVVAPTKKGRKKVEKYVDLGDVEKPKAKAAPAAKPAPKPKIVKAVAPKAPKAERPLRNKVAAPPRPVRAVVAKSEAVKDPNAGLVGVALGAAPLLLAPVVALAAAKGALSKTAARREAIQEQIAEKAAAAAKKAEPNPSADAGGIVGAVVSSWLV